MISKKKKKKETLMRNMCAANQRQIVSLYISWHM